MKKLKFIAYLRKSTKNKQQQAKHSFDTQHRIIKSFVDQIGGELIEVYEESHSGMNPNRPVLTKALLTCEEQGATLIVATLCRLSRSINQVNDLFHSSTKIVVCEYGLEVSMETILLMSCLNQLEVEKMSRRIKKGIATAKAKGVRFGYGGAPYIHKAREAAYAKAQEERRQIYPVIHGLRISGLGWKEIANHMNLLGLRTPRGKRWTRFNTSYIYKRESNEQKKMELSRREI